MVNKKKTNIVAVSGYGSSGSSPLICALKEFKGYAAMGTEFRLIKDPYGIESLESELIDNWHPLKADKAIRDFLWVSKKLNKRTSKFSTWGKNYEVYIGKEFMKMTQNYISNLTKFEYKSYWFMFDMDMSWIRCMIRKVERKLKISKEIDMYFAKPSHDEFITYTRIYLDSIFSLVSKKEKANNIIIDNAISLPFPSKSLNYFNNIKLIVVDRDPRDMYIDLMRRGLMIGKDLKRTRNVKQFTEWYKLTHEPLENLEKDNILKISFEDLVLYYESTLEKVMEFLEEDNSAHHLKKKLFDPNNAICKVGMWKNYEFQSEIKEIERALKKYCYE